MRAVLLLFVLGFVGHSYAKPQFTAIKNAFSGIFSDDCKTAAKKLDEDKTICAIIFDEEDCDDDGWSLDVRQGYTELGSRGVIFKNDESKKDDAESLIVRKGCVVFGFTEDDESEVDERGRGVAFDGTAGSSHLIVKEFTDGNIEEKLEAVNCVCGADAAKFKQIKPLTHFEKSGITDKLRSSKSALEECNYNTYIFTLAKVEGKKVCAILFDEERCNDGDKDKWKFPVGEGYTKLPFLKKNDAESAMVAPGCKLEAYDHDDKTNPAKRGKTIFVNNQAANKRGGNMEPLLKDFKSSQDLDEAISAVSCTCT